MEDPPIVDTIERIEAALARIDTVSSDAAGLRTRHQTLKETVARSLDDLDRLLAGGAAGSSK